MEGAQKKQSVPIGGGDAFDPSVIRGFASRLYVVAKLIALMGLICGFVFGMASAMGWEFGVFATFVMSLFGSAVGTLVGIEAGFLLRLTAQMALCFVQIEANTRSRS